MAVSPDIYSESPETNTHPDWAHISLSRATLPGDGVGPRSRAVLPKQARLADDLVVGAIRLENRAAFARASAQGRAREVSSRGATSPCGVAPMGDLPFEARRPARVSSPKVDSGGDGGKRSHSGETELAGKQRSYPVSLGSLSDFVSAVSVPPLFLRSLLILRFLRLVAANTDDSRRSISPTDHA